MQPLGMLLSMLSVKFSTDDVLVEFYADLVGEIGVLMLIECVVFSFSMKHVPGFIEHAEELKSKGVSDLLLISGMVFNSSVFYL